MLTKLFVKLVAFAILAVFSGLLRILWRWQQERAKETLGDVEAGRRCMLCNSSNVTSEGTGKRCQQCGHLTDMAAMQWLERATVTDDEIAAITQPVELEGVEARRGVLLRGGARRAGHSR